MIEPTLSAKFALVTQKGVIEQCNDLIALRKLACQLLEANAAMKALLLHEMLRGLPTLPATFHPGAVSPPEPPPLPPELKPKPQRKVSQFTTEQRWWLVNDETGVPHFRWGIRQELIDQGLTVDEVGHE
jgi:hypothetical protein